MGEPKKSTSANTGSAGFSAKLVTISAITPDGLTAICVDRAGVEVRVPMGIQRAKGILPVAGETWIVSQDITSGWTFSAIATKDGKPFVNPTASSGTGGGTVATLPITGAEIAPQSITGLNLAAAAAGTNLILDPAFTFLAINSTRLADAGTRGTWNIVAPNATASGAALATLALMPSALVPLYVSPGEQYYLSIGVTLSGGTATAGIQFAFNGGSFLGPDLPLSVGPNTVAQLITIPPGVSSAYVRVLVSGLSGSNTAIFTSPTCYITAGPNQLQAGSVTNAAIALGAVTAGSLAVGSVTANAIAANSVSASKMVANTITAAQLAVGIVVAGIIDGTTITGTTLQNSAANPKTSINPDGSFTVTNAGAVTIFKIFPDGTQSWYSATGVLKATLLPGGTFLVYSTPTTGGLIYSSSPAAGTDAFSNPYPAGVLATAGAISGSALTAGSVPATAVSFTARSIGGVTTTVSTAAPLSPVTGDLWINTTAGANSLNQYGGASWAPYKFGTGAIAANAITATQIAANTITATQLAAGIVYAGIVDATTIMGASVVADGTSGEVLVYSGSPVFGNLIGSWSGGSGTDSSSNPYPLGLLAQAVTLPNLSTPPASFSGASILYTDSNGGAHLLSSSGQDLVLDRSLASSASYNLPNQTSFTEITDQWTIYPNDAEASTIYMVETWGNGTWGSPGGTLKFALSLNGGLGGTVMTTSVGGVSVSSLFSFTVRLLIRVTAIGFSGVFHAHFSGSLADTGTVRQPSTSVVIEQDQSNLGIDTTATNTLAISAAWATTTSGQNLQSYGNMFTRRSI